WPDASSELPPRSFQRAIVGRHHERVIDFHVYPHLGARFHPLRIRTKRRPCRIPRSRVTVSEYVHQLIEPGDGLPESDDGHSVLLKQRDRMFTKTGVQHVGRVAFSQRVRAELETARVSCCVLDVEAGT